MDYLGAGLLAGALTGLLLGVSHLAAGLPLSSPAALAPLLAGTGLAVWLVGHERRAQVPFVPIELLRMPLVRAISLAYLFLGVGMFGAMMYVPLFVQGVLGESATPSGLVLMPLMLAMNVASVGSGHAISRSGRYRWVILPGPVVAAAGFALLAAQDEHSSLSHVIAATVVIGFGLGLLVHNLVLLVQNGVPARHLGMVTGATQLFRNAGAATGVALIGAVVASDLGSRAALGDAMSALFLGMVPLQVAMFALLLRVPELPLKPAVRDELPTGGPLA